MSSSNEDSDAEPERKRKMRRLEDSPTSTSSGSPIIRSTSITRRKRTRRGLADSDESDISSSPILNNRRKIAKVTTDSDSDTSDSDICRVRLGKPRRLQSDSSINSDESFSSQWESDYSDLENAAKPEPKLDAFIQDNNIDSDFSDGQSDKCPICLVSFKVQEIGTPESCDHTFCLECIQEWSKNMNTCPVDRHEYSLILVRESIDGKIIKQIPIEKPVPQNEVDIFEDPTFCQICESSGSEDRMLLCDGCDLGFHLFCLNPPLSEVPAGAWYCRYCFDEIDHSDIESYEMQLNPYIGNDDETQRSHGRNTSTRSIPRTRHSERVRRRIENNRHQISLNNTQSTSSSIDYSRNRQIVTSSTSRVKPAKRAKKSGSRKSNRKTKYRTVYEIDEVTGETVARKKRMKRKMRKTKKRKRRGEILTPKPKTVKKRLAQQLGICAPRSSTQNLPDVKIPSVPSDPSNTISGMRHRAGIPTLHIFGQNNELDYFSGDDEDYTLGPQLLIRRAPNHSDVSAMRRNIRHKNLMVPDMVSSTSDLLGSILISQEQFYARNASYSLDTRGKFKVETKNVVSDTYININKEQASVKESPFYPNRNQNNRYNHNYRYNQNRYQNQNQRQSNSYYHSSNQNNYYHSEPSSSMNFNNFSGTGGEDNNDYPQDYSRRTLCGTAESNLEENEDASEATNNRNSESEVDIYSDIETVTTSKAEDGDQKPPTPPIISNTANAGTDDDNNDSEPDMVIDDEKVQEHESQNEYYREEAAVTSTVDVTRHFELSASAEDNVPHNSMEIQSEAVQSSSLDDIKSYQYYNDDSSDGCPNTNVYSRDIVKPSNDEDMDSDDGCPNFSIYSKESKTVALHTDISLSSEKVGCTDYQVGEVSSSPNIVEGSSNNPQESYDPEQIYEADEPQNYDLEQTYDPEKTYDQNDSSEKDSSYNPNKTYDPETCLHQDETADLDKRFDEDQSYDPEKIYDEESNSNDHDKTYYIEKEVLNFKSAPGNTMNISTLDRSDIGIGDRYDPAIPFNDDLDETKAEQVADIDEDNKSYSEKEEATEDNEGENSNRQKEKDVTKPIIKGGILGGLYSDSEDDSVVRKDSSAFAISDINHMTEDISEEERSYTPCLDEKSQKQGLEGLDTEMISDEDRNDFDESHELKTVSDGDALEINAKESELDFTRPEDYEEGEIVDKSKGQEVQSDEPETDDVPDKSKKEDQAETKKSKKKEKEKTSTEDKSGNKENESGNKDNSFRKLSKNTKERNYRDKERRTSPKSRSKERDHSKKEKKKEKRKELERYNVRAIIAEKPRPLIAKDQFGRDIRTTPSRSRSRSYTPPIRRSTSRPIRSPSKSRRSLSRSRRSRSLSRRRKSPSKEKSRKGRKSRNFRSASRSRSGSRSPVKKDARSKTKKRKRSSSAFRKRKSGDRGKNKKRTSRSRHRSRSATPLPRVQRDWDRREWSPMSQSPTGHMSPSWTPPRIMDNSQLLRNENLTVTVNNSSKKKKEKKRKGERRNKESIENRQKKRRHERERTPPPSKEVFASGDNILVSVSFNNENETRDISTRDKRKNDDSNKKRKEKEKKKKNRKDLSGVKPVAIIDLDRSPFRELTPSPKQIIVLTDSDNEDNENLRNVQDGICDSSQQVASPERGIGPKTPPEPQVKFSLTAKPPQVRAINNPLHDPEDMETNDNVEDEISRVSPAMHIGPNTPPEPPNSPPSSPDAYDPFEPTKSRSPTPERQSQSKLQDSHESIDRTTMDVLEKSTNPVPEATKSLTPPIADVQPADSQSSIQVTPDSNLDKSPDRNIAQIVQQSLKPVAQTTPFSSVPPSIITSTPVPSNTAISRINILNATIITPTVASSIPQRIVLPNQIKSSPVKISPNKTAIKSTPIKPMPNKNNKMPRKRAQNGGTNDEIVLDFDSPYSPGSSDYEDLFEPPSEIVTKPVIKGKIKSPQKHASAFDALFGSPGYNTKQKTKTKVSKKNSGSKTKTVGVKLDEDNLKILDELPNSAVEMQVKDKFLKKLNRQERVVEEVKLVLKPHYNKKRITKEEYKDILRRSVPKICHNKSGEINPTKIKNLIEAYVRKLRHSKKVTSSSSVNPLKM